MLDQFVQSAAILLREGLEAMLVLAALAGYLKKAGAGGGRLAALYAGAAAAVVASLIAAWLFQILNNGVHNDIVEGLVILCAVALMLYVSGWLLIRQDPRAWQGYLATKADRALAQDTGVAIGLLAFLAVFREGAETILFMYALVKTAGGWTSGLIAGSLAAAAALAILFYFINLVAQRIPLRPLFVITSGFLFVMAIKMLGDAVQEFQEQRLLPYDDLQGWEWLSGVGLNPTVEALAAQASIVALAVISFVVWRWTTVQERKGA
ncbi:Ferrous iron permease EfeU [subsurface metagenome]